MVVFFDTLERPTDAMHPHNLKVIYSLAWATESLESDLDAVYDHSPADGLLVDALLDLLEESAELRACLAEGRFRHIKDPRFDAAPVQWGVRLGYNLYYLKMWREDGVLVRFRLFYAVDHAVNARVIWVLGLMPRSDNYDENSDFAKRIRADHDRYGIPRIRSH
jgi:hypothetical protein